MGAVVGLSALLGLGAAWFSERSRARALRELADAAQGLAEGKLDQEITLTRQDELGALADALRDIIAYQQQLARAVDAIARGDLAQTIRPRSEHDVLGMALANMVPNLRDLVISIENDQEDRPEGPTRRASTGAADG